MNFRLSYLKVLIVIFIGSIVFVSKISATQNQSESQEEIITSNSSLRLLGTIMESDPTKSIAVIKNLFSQRQGIYKVTDKILDYQIIKIMRGRIALLRDGKIYILNFPLGGEVEPIIVVSSDKRIVNYNALTKKIPDLNVAMKQAIPIPYIESGKITGLKITKVKDKALIETAGLKEEDIVMSINGKKLDSLQRALEIYHNFLGNKDRADIEIRRGNEIKKLTYYIY